MKEEYVKSGTAKLLKENGFDIPPDTSYEDYLWQMYDEDGKVHWGMYNSDWYFRITQQMACDWVEKTYGFFIEISRSIDLNGNYHYFYMILDKTCKYASSATRDNNYSSKSDAVEAALKYVLTNLI